MNLSTPLSQAGHSYKLYAKRLEKLDITSLGDFLTHLPFRYDDFTNIIPINKARVGDVVTIQATITDVKNDFTKRFKSMQKIKIKDQTGEMEILWFNQPYLVKTFHIGDTISLSGRIEWQGKKPGMITPSFEILTSDQTLHTARLVPIYPETKGVSSKWLRRQVFTLLKSNQSMLTDYLPEGMRKDLGYVDYETALATIHFPHTLEDAQKAKERLAFDEVFLIQLAATKRRSEWKQKIKGNPFTTTNHQEKLQAFFSSLPFSLTNAQNRAVTDILQDISKNEPMNRLLEGDVGSGKTVVATVGMFVAYLNGFQSVLMAPTEILAQQHFATIESLLKPFGIQVHLATGSKNTLKEKKETTFDILIGTHAVLSEKLTFEKLGLVIIDEQQRFGVEQRAIIRQKGTNPHLLTMTATPIPRTVALTLYGDLDLSLLDEMPIGRLPIKTWLVPVEKRKGAYEWIGKQIAKGDQAFIVCPFIEESESMSTVKAATKEFEKLQKEIYPTLRLGLLHGRLKSKEKQQVLQDFREKKIDILVATPVVEVGIDIPNATIIVIEAADRFGLSQLHQLRGRVGRGEKQSYCLLFTESTASATTRRLKAMETMHNGASLAELDLKMRGAGELYGTLQHGKRWLKIADFSDTSLLEKAKHEAMAIFPRLHTYPLLLQKLEESNSLNVTPD